MPELELFAYGNGSSHTRDLEQEPVDEDFWYDSDEESFDEESFDEESLMDDMEDNDEDDEEEEEDDMDVVGK